MGHAAAPMALARLIGVQPPDEGRRNPNDESHQNRKVAVQTEARSLGTCRTA